MGEVLKFVLMIGMFIVVVFGWVGVYWVLFFVMYFVVLKMYWIVLVWW